MLLLSGWCSRWLLYGVPCRFHLRRDLVLIPEIFPNRLRGKGSSISTFVNWSTNAFSAFAFPWYIAHYGLGTGYFTFAAICLVATVFFWKLVPDKRKDAGGDRDVLDGGLV